ncbi:FIST signal transduction protein [Miltoncostaea oceani]|uniref:FIST signal transduction protein n=1 Tax=Miltoncostaea oceani TaxID=2843216 RepID=UPI001C3E642F|nr:FIST N-terminal domain-containing protein [Miltoncostaea oceani]
MDVVTLSHDGARWSGDRPRHLDSAATAVIVFGAPGLRDRDDVFAELAAAFPTSCVIGCSSAGEIHGDTLRDGSLTVAVVRFARTALRAAEAPVAGPADSRAAGALIAADLAGPGLRAVFVLSDGLAVNGSELAAGLAGALPADVQVTGGLAADGDRFASTWVLSGGRPRTGIVSAIGLYGPHVGVGHGSRGGWEKFGPERTVTRSHGNVLYELDGRPALALYKEYLGRRADGLPATGPLFPLEVRLGDGAALVRTILGVDEDAQSLTFAGDLPTGARAQLMRANLDRLVDGSEQAASGAAAAHAPGAPVLAIGISCVGRRLVLGEFCEDEVEASLAVLPAGSTQVGFYSYGEIAPAGGGTCDLHNQTMTITTLSEA